MDAKAAALKSLAAMVERPHPLWRQKSGIPMTSFYLCSIAKQSEGHSRDCLLTTRIRMRFSLKRVKTATRFDNALVELLFERDDKIASLVKKYGVF